MAGDYGQVPERYGKKFLPLGITLVVLGSLSVVFGIVTIALWVAWAVSRSASVTVNVPGIYVGIVGIIAGSLSIRTSKFATSCSVIAGLVFGILLLPGSVYMMYIEATGISITSAYGLGSQAAVYGLSWVCGFGMFVSDIIFLVFSGKSKSLAG